MSEEIKKLKKKIMVDYKVLEMEIEEEMWEAVLYRLDIMKEKIEKVKGKPEEKMTIQRAEFPDSAYLMRSLKDAHKLK